MSLPEGWAEATLGDVSDFIMGQAPPGTACNAEGRGTPFVKAGEFGQDRPIIREWTTKPLKLAEKNDVLICVVGATAGKLNLGADCAIGRSVAAIRPTEATTADFIYPRLRSEVARLRSGSTGTAQGVISKDMLSEVTFDLPPLAEQRRIVDRLDALTARLTRARAELDRVPVLAERLRSSVLSRAFSGELTADWRAANGLNDADWPVHSLGEIAEVQGGIQVGKKRPADAVLLDTPYLRVANVQRGWLKLEEIKTLGVTEHERSRLLLRDGDILMNEGGDRDKLGRGWVWHEEVPDCIHQNHVFRIRLTDDAFPPEFISHYANEFGQQYFIDQGTQTTNLASISKRRVMALPVPVPPTDEAVEVLRLVDAAFARADRLEAEAAKARALLDRMEAAILARAFRGELVPQDPADEPAHILLDRIRAERAAAPKPKRGRRKKEVA